MGAPFGQSVREEEGTLLEIRAKYSNRTQVTADVTINLMTKFIVKHCWGLKSLTLISRNPFTLRPGFCQHLNTNCWNCLNLTGGFSVMDLPRLTRTTVEDLTPKDKDTASVVV